MDKKENKWSIGDANKSVIYILPLLGKNYNEFLGRHMPLSQFRNCFIGDAHNNITDSILLLYKFSGESAYLNFESKLSEHINYRSKYEVDKQHTMFVFNIPDNKIDDYNKIINGKYSEISDESKKSILSFHGLRNESIDGYESNTGGVLYKTSVKREKLEEFINAGLPRTQWTRIDSKTELDSPFDKEIEYYQSRYIVKDVMAPSSEF